MRKLLSFLILLCLKQTLHAQYIYTIKADSVKITNSCDTAELIIENHTQTIPGFLFNKGRGRTEFRRIMQRLNDTLVVIGGDSLRLPYAWLQGGNRFGTIGKFGTLDNNPIDYYTNNILRGRWNANGNLNIGNSGDNGHKFQLYGSSYFEGTQHITGSWSDSNGASHMQYYPSITNIGRDWSEIAGVRIAPTINFTSNNQLGYGLLVEPNFVHNGTSQYPDAISSAVHVKTLAGGIKISQTGSINGNSGQPLFIEQNNAANKEMINLFRNHIPCTFPFIWQNDTRPLVGNNSAIVPAIRSTIARVEAGGGVSYTMDRYYWGTEAAMEMKYETTPRYDSNINQAKHTSISFKSMNNGTLYTSLYLYGERVGMGTNIPSAQLHTTGSVRFAGLTNDNSQARVIVSDINGNLYWRDAGSIALNETMNSDLAVNGRLFAQQMLITQTGRWPDYVFSKQYKLPSLTEVESFINQNSHLPGIPSAAEVEKKGIDVGSSQAAQLKKIEELTLYIIQQDKELKTLKQEVEELKALIKGK
jgi:hypothetical protein